MSKQLEWKEIPPECLDFDCFVCGIFADVGEVFRIKIQQFSQNRFCRLTIGGCTEGDYATYDEAKRAAMKMLKDRLNRATADVDLLKEYFNE